MGGDSKKENPMGTFRIGDANLNFEMIGAGVQNGELPEQHFDHPWDLTLEEARDLAAFQESGWFCVPEPDLNWGAVRDKNGPNVEAALIARHPWGGLVMVHNRVVAIAPGGLPPEVPPLPPESRVPFADDTYNLRLPIPDGNLEGSIHAHIAFFHALDGGVVAEVLVSYHLVPKGTVVPARVDPLTQWQWTKIQLEDAWAAATTEGQGVRIAVIDLGFHEDEPEISPNNTAFITGVGGLLPGLPVPPNAHGTMCAGIASANNDHQGVNGAAPGSSRLLISVRTISSQLGVAGAIALARNSAVDVISCSLGPNGRPWELSTVLREQLEKAQSIGRNGLGIPIFWADFDASGPIPATSVEASPAVVCVGHTNRHDRVAPCGSGVALALVAPGVGLPAIIRQGAASMVGLAYGASVAAPIAAGIAAVILSMKRGLTSGQVVEAIQRGCDPPANPKVRIDNTHGWGRLNALQAVEVAKTL